MKKLVFPVKDLRMQQFAFLENLIHHFTTFEMSLVYYKDNDIVVEKGDYIHV